MRIQFLDLLSQFGDLSPIATKSTSLAAALTLPATLPFAFVAPR